MKNKLWFRYWLYFKKLFLVFWRSLQHANILHYIGIVDETDKKKIWIIMEYVDGGTMEMFCKRGRIVLSDDHKKRIACSCWSGLGYLHKRKIYHKDIKPENILVCIVSCFLFNFWVSTSEFSESLLTQCHSLVKVPCSYVWDSLVTCSLLYTARCPPSCGLLTAVIPTIWPLVY